MVLDRHLHYGTGRVLQLDEPIPVVLQPVDLSLVGEQAVVLEVLMETDKMGPSRQ